MAYSKYFTRPDNDQYEGDKDRWVEFYDDEDKAVCIWFYRPNSFLWPLPLLLNPLLTAATCSGVDWVVWLTLLLVVVLDCYLVYTVQRLGLYAKAILVGAVVPVWLGRGVYTWE